MKISKLFHWLYAAVMMLPLFLFPIFGLAVRSDNNYQPIEVNYGGGYDVSPKYNSVEVTSNDDLLAGNVYNFQITTLVDLTENDVINFEGKVKSGNLYIEFDDASFDDTSIDILSTGLILHFQITEADFYLECYYDDLGTYIDYGALNYWYFSDFVLEINHIDCFGNAYTYFHYSDYQEYDVTYVDGQIYNDTDVGSQMVYTAYRVVDNYFNYDNVFNFKDLYTWLETTFFSGQAPMGFFIFWHLLIYWLLTSLLWLLFDVLMYVPQLVHRWLDKASIS